MHARACTQEKLGDAVCWSNGNLFRCITLLAVTHLEKAGIVRVVCLGGRIVWRLCALGWLRVHEALCVGGVVVVVRNFLHPR